MDELTNKVLNDYKLLLTKIQINEINIRKAGFINNSCISYIYSYLLHCIENIDIFTKEELNYIHTTINTILYGNKI